MKATVTLDETEIREAIAKAIGSIGGVNVIPANVEIVVVEEGMQRPGARVSATATVEARR